MENKIGFGKFLLFGSGKSKNEGGNKFGLWLAQHFGGVGRLALITNVCCDEDSEAGVKTLVVNLADKRVTFFVTKLKELHLDDKMYLCTLGN